MSTTPWIAGNLTDEQRAVFYSQMSAWQKDEVVGVLLALFLGTFGAHHFYLRRTGLGILYLVFSFTGIPTIVSLVECFFMPARVRQYNLALATYFAGQVGAISPAGYSAAAAFSSQPAAAPAAGQAIIRTCEVCGSGVLPEAKFCARCG